MKLGIFVTGTNTGVGKTMVSSLLVSALKGNRIRTGYFKPVQTGLDSDVKTVSELTGINQNKWPSPVYSFPQPMAPARAGVINGQSIQIDQIVHKWKELESGAWVIEGAGGLLVPLNSRQTIRDLIQALEVRMILVAGTQLGTINHTLLTVEAARSVNIPIAGIVLVGDEDPGLAETLTDMAEVPVLARVPFYSSLSCELIRTEAANLFSLPILRALYD